MKSFCVRHYNGRLPNPLLIWIALSHWGNVLDMSTCANVIELSNMTQFGQKSPLPDGIVSYSVEMAGNNDVKGDQDDEAQVRPLLCLTGQTQARRSVHFFLSCHRKTLT